MSELNDLKNYIIEFNEQKDNVSYDYEGDYNKILNLCAEIDDKYYLGLCDYVYDMDFVDDNEMEYLIERNSTDIDRLRCFIGDTYSAAIYKLDGYGNLANIDSSDIECLIEEVTQIIEDRVKDLEPEM
jgi:hypothetical protein